MRINAAAAAFAAAIALGCGGAAPPHIILATTTSVQNAGLLDRLLPAFRTETGIEVRVHLAGSGRALQMMRRGDADLVISHAPEAEATALGDHPDWQYRKIMFNDFVVVGPRHDPAGIRGRSDVGDVFTRIAGAGVRFVSRGDQSGTHERETSLWTLAGSAPAADRLITTGAGMATTLRAASDQDAYTLTDRATFVQLRPRLQLELLHEGDPRLLNTYAVIVGPGERMEDAMRFARWISEGAGRRAIEEYRLEGGFAAFRVWPDGCPANRPDDAPCDGRALPPARH